MNTQTPLEIQDRREWRTWLARHHASSAGVWLLFYKAHTGRQRLAYEDSVREALCFGWIDSLVKRLDDDRYALKFTPRKPASKWSDLNRKRWAEMQAAGLLAEAGLAARPTDKRYAPKPSIPTLPAYVATALEGVPGRERGHGRFPDRQQLLVTSDCGKFMSIKSPRPRGRTPHGDVPGVG